MSTVNDVLGFVGAPVRGSGPARVPGRAHFVPADEPTVSVNRDAEAPPRGSTLDTAEPAPDDAP